MYSPKPRLVLGQALLIVCFSIAPLLLGSAKGDAEPSPLLADKTVPVSVKIDTTSQLVGEVAQIPILIRNDVQLGRFDLEVDFCHQHLTLVGAERGEALLDTTDGEYDWEFFTYRLLPFGDTLHRVQLFGAYDLPNGHRGNPLGPNARYVELVVLQFVIENSGIPNGTFLPLTFEWETTDCLENTFQNLFYDTLYVSQDSLEFNSVDCPPESLDFLAVLPSLEFVDGGVYALHPATPNRGDINLNLVPYEVADLVLFASYLAYGDSVLISPEGQTANSDVNWDGYFWSMADFIHLARVILHDGVEVTQPTALSENHGETWMTTVHSLPNDTVVVPVWYRGTGSESVQGISFKVDFNPDSLSLLAVDFSQTSLESWEGVYTRLKNGSIRINACPDFMPSSASDSLTSDGAPQQLVKLVFQVSEVDTPTFISVSFGDDTSSQIQANAFATTDGQLTRLGISDVRNGGVQVGGSLECKRGDINLNSLPYEVADALLFHNVLLQGPGILLIDPELQTCASDVNADGLYWTIADLLYLVRVILHDSPEIPAKGPKDVPYADEFQVVSSSAQPGDLVSVPIWLSDSAGVWGTTFRLVFDQSNLSVEGVEVEGTRTEGWELAHAVADQGEAFFLGYTHYPLNDGSYISMNEGQGVLVKIQFRVNQSATPGEFLPVTFEPQGDWGRYNAYTDTEGTSLVQPTTISGTIFTDAILGDANSDAMVDVADVVYLLNYLFKAGQPPAPLGLGDYNQDGEVNVADAVALLNYLFRS
jgi:hypothetical protein